MKTITQEQYQVFAEQRKLSKKINKLNGKKKLLKEELLKIFGRSKHLQTSHGTILSIATISIEPTEIPKAYTYETVKEI